MESLGERITFLRKEKGLSQRKLMEILEFDNLSKYEKNQRKPNYEILKRIADFFNVSTDWLLVGEASVIKEKNKSVSSMIGELTSEEVRILKLFRQLNDRDKIKIEGIIEDKIDEAKHDKKGFSSNYQNGRTAVTDDKKHA